MIEYLEIEQTLSTRGVYFDINEFNYALKVVLGEKPYMAYATSIDIDNYKKVKGSEDEKDYFAKIRKDVDALSQTQHIIQLVEELKYRHTKLIQDAALKLDDIELTSSDVKKVLAAFLKDRINDPASANVKELVDLLRMYQPYLPDDNTASDFQRHFIQIHEPFNALCTRCNKEISIYKGVSCVCPYCGAKYTWFEEENRFRPMPDTL